MSDDSEDLTPDEGFLVRRAAVVIGIRLREYRIASMLHEIADEAGAPDECEGCPLPATGHDVEGLPFCDTCAASHPAAWEDDT